VARWNRTTDAKDLPVSPLPMFLLATAALAAFALFLITKTLRTRVPARRPVALRQKRLEEQMNWDRRHRPPADA